MINIFVLQERNTFWREKYKLMFEKNVALIFSVRFFQRRKEILIQHYSRASIYPLLKWWWWWWCVCEWISHEHNSLSGKKLTQLVSLFMYILCSKYWWWGKYTLLKPTMEPQCNDQAIFLFYFVCSCDLKIV